MNHNRKVRRNILIIAGLGIAAISMLAFYALYRSSIGESPAVYSPYISTVNDTLEEGSAVSCPILLVTGSSSEISFGNYLGEILLAEGFNCFHTISLDRLDTRALEPYDVVILAESALDDNQVEALENYVFSGGALIAMRPDPELSSLLGINPLPGSISEGYIKIEENHPAAKGINSESLQFHGTADRYSLAGAESVAWISDESSVPADVPGITINQYGQGQAAMWAFDLAQSVALTRQGNPEQADQDLDGLEGSRTVDLFVDWVDLDRISIPQADEQQRLLANLLVELTGDKSPLPRLWYFPGGADSVVVATGDSHANPAPYIDEVLKLINEYDAHMSVYYTPQPADSLVRMAHQVQFLITDHVPVIGDFLAERFTSPTPGMVDSWRALGHEFTLHPYVEEGLEEGWKSYWQEFTGKGYGPVSPSVRTHRVLWNGWTETARVQASNGIRMNMDYYHVGPSLKKNDGEWVFGHLTGSGLPMRFVDDQGRILDIFQQNTQLADEHLLDMNVPEWGGWADVSAEEAVAISRKMIDSSIEPGGYSATTFQFHVDPFQIGGSAAEKAREWLIGTLDYASELGLPVLSAEDWLHFVELRFDSRFENVSWSPEDKTLRFELNPPVENDQKLEVLLPLNHDLFELSSVIVDGVEVTHGTRQLGGITYAAILVDAGPHNFSVTYQ